MPEWGHEPAHRPTVPLPMDGVLVVRHVRRLELREAVRGYWPACAVGLGIAEWRAKSRRTGTVPDERIDLRPDVGRPETAVGRVLVFLRWCR